MAMQSLQRSVTRTASSPSGKMQPALVAAVVAAVVGAGSSAQAGGFGGFSADETRYLSGRDTICAPLAAKEGRARGVPECESADAGRVAALKFRRGTEQRGAGAAYEARARGTTLTVRSRGGSAGDVLTWTTTDPISRITGVYLSRTGKLLAVQYESRFGGRLRTEVVAFVLPAEGAGVAKDGASQGAGATVAPKDGTGQGAGAAEDASGGPPELSPRAQKALKRARRLAKRGRHRAALRAYRRVLAEDAKHAEARYGLARGLARRRKHDAALAELRALAASDRDDAIIWLVEARFEPAFAKLRGNAEFRAATGLTPAAGKTRSLYERLVGFSSTWEQPETLCESAQINLDLDRLARTFGLRITSRCGGYEDVTRLRGTWSLAEPDRVLLSLPKTRKDQAADVIPCTMQTCSDEDCLHCQIDVDLEFLLRPVRR